LMLNKPLVDREQWDESAIAERGEILTRRILGIWPGPTDEDVHEPAPAPAASAPVSAFETVTVRGPVQVSPAPLSAEGMPATPEAFHGQMVELYKRAKLEAGYTAGYFLSMLSDIGGLETAQHLLHTAEPSDGYVALWERGRLDLTVEATVLIPRWRPLFTDEELTTARTRLEAYDFQLEAFLATGGPSSPVR
jgi:hypothetical protein